MEYVSGEPSSAISRHRHDERVMLHNSDRSSTSQSVKFNPKVRSVVTAVNRHTSERSRRDLSDDDDAARGPDTGGRKQMRSGRHYSIDDVEFDEPTGCNNEYTPGTSERRSIKTCSSNNKRRNDDSDEDEEYNSDHRPSKCLCQRKKRPDDDDGSSDDEDGEYRREKRGRRHRECRRKPRSNRSFSSSHSCSRRNTVSRRTENSDDCSSSYRHRQRIKLEKYDGTSCVEAFITKFKKVAKHNGWTADDKAAHLMTSLNGSASYVLFQNENASYEEILEKLRMRYGSRQQHEKFRVELKYRRRKPNETLQELGYDVERLVALAYPGADITMRDILARDSFVDALDNAELEAKVREKEPTDFASAITMALKLEILSRPKPNQYETQRPRAIRQVQQHQEQGLAYLDEPADRPIKSSKSYTGTSVPGKGKSHVPNVDFNRSRPHQQKNDYSAPKFENKEKGNDSQEQLKRRVEDLTTQMSHMSAQMQDMAAAMSQQVFASQRPISANHGIPQATMSQFAPQTSSRFPAPMTQRGPTSANQPPQCFGCGSYGHFVRDCTNRPPPTQMSPSGAVGQATPTYKNNMMHVQHQDSRIGLGSYEGYQRPTAQETCLSDKVYLNVKLRGRKRQCLLDSGCEVTVIPAKFVPMYGIRPASKTSLAANGTDIPILGVTTLRAYLGCQPIEISGLVTEHVTDIMLGFDWLRDNGVKWNFSEGEIVIDDVKHQLVARKNYIGTMCRRVIVAHDTVVPPRSQLDIQAKTVYDKLRTTPQLEESAWATEPAEPKRGLLVARTLLPNKSEEVPVRVLNTSEEPIRLNHGTVVTELQPVVPLIQQDEASSSSYEAEEIIDDMVSKVDPMVPQDMRLKLQNLLSKYSSVFSRGEWDLGWTDLVTHRIDTGGARPIRQPLRRYPPLHLTAIDEHLKDMLNQGVIEPAASPWASNIVLARKKDGSLRCCIDFRQVNDVTRKDAYPLPKADQCLDAMNGSFWFSTFDLRSGFHQVALAPEDADKTAFITRRGLFRFRTMPFGLCNAVATFQRLMDLVLSGLNLDICLAYLDDIILFSKTPEEHVERLEILLQRLSDMNLKLKPSKCALMQRKVTFLGHVVSGEGVATDPEKIKLISEWPEPTNIRQLRGFLGLSGYYRRFVKDYSHIANPLNKLLKKDQRFVWNEECQMAFDKLKLALSSPPILALPNDNDLFILDTDASEFSIGCVLSQVQDGDEKVIAYAGRTLNKNEVNYCVTRKELLAIVHFTKLFRQYLLGRRFVIRTDHAALSWLQRTPEPIGQNARWLEQLGEYDYEIQHRKGHSHGNADALSRHPCLKRPSCSACHPPCHPRTDEAKCAAISSVNQQNSEEPPLNILGWTLNDIQRAQRNDADINFIRVLMEDSTSEKPPWSKVEGQSSDVKSMYQEWERLILHNDILFRRWMTHDGGSRKQVILPREFREPFIQLAHTGMTGGHLGRKKTEEQVNLRAYWPNWRSDVSTELRKCTECAQYHRGTPARQTPLNPFSAGEPFEVVSVDITGKHPRSSKGNEYIVTVVDLFSKWGEAIPVRVHTAPVVASVLVNHVFSRFGMPKKLLTDQGKEFESELFKELCNKMEIQKVRTSPYKPSTNGCVERFHRTLNAMLGKIVSYSQRDWDEHIPFVMAAYRAAKHASTGFSPNYLVFGRENRAPLDVVLGEIVGEEEHYDSYNDYVCALQKRMRQSHALAREHLGAAAERRKNDYDSKVKSREFRVGQWVWYYYPRRYVKRSPKWTKNYDGPFLVVGVIPPCDYRIQKSKKSTVQVVHGDKLKLCYYPVTQSWLTNPDQQNEPAETADMSRPAEEARESLEVLPVRQDRPKRRRTAPQIDEQEILQLPPRQRRLPRYFQDYQT